MFSKLNLLEKSLGDADKSDLLLFGEIFF